MEKLIELLNEWYQERYDTKTRFDKFENYGGNDYGYFKSNDNGHFMYETDVWTKKYGFIKRLVEKDKIDFEGMSGHGKIISYLTDEKDYKWNDIKEGVVLMLLSISNSPIDDLISYLK